MYIDTIPNRDSPPCILLRESYRDNGRVKKRTLANLSALPQSIIEGIKLLFKQGIVLENIESVEVIESQPHGHVACLLSKAKQIGLDKLIYSRSSKQRSLSLCMIAGRLLFPGSKLSLSRNAHLSSLAKELNLSSSTDEDDFYECLDWLYQNQERIEKKLASKHLENGKLILYDISSAYLEGSTCSLAARGYSRDKRRDKLQIVFGLVCTKEGCPVSIKVFKGNTADSSTVGSLVDSLTQQYSLSDVVIAGDRGMICNKNIKEDFRDRPVSWISALTKAQILKLHKSKEKKLDLTSIGENEYKEITTKDFPGERIIVCKNPLVADKAVAQRKSILDSLVAKLEEIQEATNRSNKPLASKEKIGIRVGKVIKSKQKWFNLDIQEGSFSFEVNHKQLKSESLLDGIYAIRTSLPKKKGTTEDIIGYYKSLSKVEDAFRSIKTTEIKLRPIFHSREPRVKAHVFVCMLAYYLEWHLRKDWKDLLFDDEQPQRESIIRPAKPSQKAKEKYATKKNSKGIPISSFNDLIYNLSCVQRVKMKLPVGQGLVVERTTKLNSVQRKAIELIGAQL